MKYSRFIYLCRQELLRRIAVNDAMTFVCLIARDVSIARKLPAAHSERLLAEVHRITGRPSNVFENFLSEKSCGYTDVFRDFFLRVMLQRALIEEKSQGEQQLESIH